MPVIMTEKPRWAEAGLFAPQRQAPIMDELKLLTPEAQMRIWEVWRTSPTVLAERKLETLSLEKLFGEKVTTKNSLDKFYSELQQFLAELKKSLSSVHDPRHELYDKMREHFELQYTKQTRVPAPAPGSDNASNTVVCSNGLVNTLDSDNTSTVERSKGLLNTLWRFIRGA